MIIKYFVDLIPHIRNVDNVTAFKHAFLDTIWIQGAIIDNKTIVIFIYQHFYNTYLYLELTPGIALFGYKLSNPSNRDLIPPISDNRWIRY